MTKGIENYHNNVDRAWSLVSNEDIKERHPNPDFLVKLRKTKDATEFE